MRCPEAERRIDQFSESGRGELEPAVVAHLEACADCRSYLQATQTLSRDLAVESRIAQSAGKSLPALRSEIEAAISAQNWRMRLMARIQSQLETRPAMITGIGLAVVVLLFAVLVPLPYEQQTGYAVSLAGVSSADDRAPQLIEAAFAALGHEEVEVATEGEGDAKELVIRNLPDSATAQAAYEAAVALYGSLARRRVEIKRRYEEAQATFAAQMFEKARVKVGSDVHLRFVKGGLEIEGDNISNKLRDLSLPDSEVSAEIDRIFASHGVSREDIDFTVTTDPVKKLRTLTLEKLPRADTPEEEGPELIFDVEGQDVYARAHKGEVTLNPDLSVFISIPGTDNNSDKVTLRINLKNWGD